RKRQSSSKLPGPPNAGFCAHGGPSVVASRVPIHGLTGIGSRQRRSPTGGCANGIPRKAAPPLSSNAPRICPPVTETLGPDAAPSANIAATAIDIVAAVLIDYSLLDRGAPSGPQ